jgi:hypothetical protein
MISSLYGYISNPIYDDTLYILKETKISPTEFHYDGLIGYGFHEHDFDSVPASIVIDVNTGERIEEKNLDRVISNPEYPVKYIPTDMRELKFTYDAVKNLVTLDTYWRYEICEEEATAIRENIVYEDKESDDHSDYSYPYLRFPRSKDGISLTRLFDHFFPNKNVDIFLPKSYLG